MPKMIVIVPDTFQISVFSFKTNGARIAFATSVTLSSGAIIVSVPRDKEKPWRLLPKVYRKNPIYQVGVRRK